MTIHIRQPLPSPGIETLIDDALFAAPTGASYDRLAKRILDITIVMLGALPVLLVTMVLAAIIALDGKSPFYLQKRVGRNGRVFYMYKLRSMVVDADSRLEAYLASNPEARAEWNHAQKLRRDPRITAVGRLIRKTSLDELPQLFNILVGNMSFVGPRPPLRLYVEDFPHTYARVLRNRPGVTGLASLHFHEHEARLLASCQTAKETDRVYRRRCIPRKARLDLIYQKHRNICFDLLILFKTLASVLRKRGK